MRGRWLRGDEWWRPLPPLASADAVRVLAARGVRAFGDGYVALLLPIYLVELGYSALAIGAIVTSTLIGTALGVPQELSKLDISLGEARERCDESIRVLDAALKNGVVSHQGKHFEMSGLRLLPRPLQQPAPPSWMAIMGAEAARRAAQRRSRICTGFSATGAVKAVFDAYRDEATAAGFEAGPEWLALRRRISLGTTMDEARDSAAAAFDRLSAFVAEDQRFAPKVPDAPAQSATFKISEDEFITGTPKEVAGQIIEQCKATGAGNFLAVLHWSAPIEEVERAHELFGREVIPLLRAAAV